MMRPLLKDGKLITPATLIEGARRRSLVERECATIKTQLEDESRRKRQQYLEPGSYEDWFKRAAHKLSQFGSEIEAIDSWLSDKDKLLREADRVRDLLLEAWVLLREYRVTGTRREADLLRKLDAYFDEMPAVGVR
jgi:hypothetical protein